MRKRPDIHKKAWHCHGNCSLLLLVDCSHIIHSLVTRPCIPFKSNLPTIFFFQQHSMRKDQIITEGADDQKRMSSYSISKADTNNTSQICVHNWLTIWPRHQETHNMETLTLRTTIRSCRMNVLTYAPRLQTLCLLLLSWRHGDHT